jgi:putative nucleotidyltransferase with HDIG domain
LIFLLLIPIELIISITEVLFADNKGEKVILLAYGAFGSFSSIMLYMILLPVFEIIFSELTIFRLRELTSNDAKLIKKLKNEAPGTYNHSVVVAQLCEACANAIGEDGELARAVALYHDVGKLKNPEMFTENQTEYNMHNELSPELSADIIRSHARDGAQLIRKNHLPSVFADVAVEHHGTLPVKYFYIKAMKMSDGEINAANYSYAGPTPRTRLSAIVMIADAAEAVTRSLQDRSPANVEKMVRNIIEERIDLEQFVNCDITMKELTIMSQTIAQSLCGVYHSRIAYPKLKMSKKNK